MFDQAIIKTVTDVENKIREEEYLRHTTTTVATTTVADDDDEDKNSFVFDSPSNETDDYDDDSDDEESTGSNGTIKLETATEPIKNELSEQSETTVSSETEVPMTTTQLPPTISTIVRKKRQADFLSTLLNGPAEEEDEEKFPGYIVTGNMHTYTKQFPYPKYRRDNFLTGLYIAQCIQLTFFFALIVQVTSAVRNRIWLKESGNSTVSLEN